MEALNNKLVGILLQERIIKANYTALPMDGRLTKEEIDFYLQEEPRLLEPLLTLIALQPKVTQEALLPDLMLKFIVNLRNEVPVAEDYEYANYRKTLQNYLFIKDLKHLK